MFSPACLSALRTPGRAWDAKESVRGGAKCDTNEDGANYTMMPLYHYDYHTTIPPPSQDANYARSLLWETTEVPLTGYAGWWWFNAGQAEMHSQIKNQQQRKNENLIIKTLKIGNWKEEEKSLLLHWYKAKHRRVVNRWWQVHRGGWRCRHMSSWFMAKYLHNCTHHICCVVFLFFCVLSITIQCPSN